MAAKYDFKEIEAKWRKKWLEEKVFRADDDSKKPKYYQLETFPYPSAAGLHVGHPKGYIAEDIHARYMRMNGREVLYTMGWDAFGLPTENYAIKVGRSPQEVAEENVKNFRRQVRMFGLSYDWDREINTSNPEYYKWTQWLFIKLWEKGLAYRKKALVNWCPEDRTVLANEQVVGGRCERCGTAVEQREMEQWFFKITDYAERLLNDLDYSVGHCEGAKRPWQSQQENGIASPVARNDCYLDWPAASVKRQKDWIGKSEGTEIDFEVKTAEPPNFVLIHGYTGSPEKNFFPWLRKELEDRGYKVQAPTLPNAKNPDIEEQVNYVLDNVRFDDNTVILGHSLGSVVAMKSVERRGPPIRKLVLVAGFSRPPSARGHIRDYEKSFNWKFDFGKISGNIAGGILILRDSGDTIVPSAEADVLEEKLGGSVVDFKAELDHARAEKEPEVLRNVLDAITVFTTRPDTLFGATYMVLAPEHPLVTSHESRITNHEEVREYAEKAKHKTELQRKEEAREKTGVELKGVKAVNPATKEEIPIWVADYVLASVGTGAIMAVPAHDERDFEFAKKYELPIREVILQKFGQKKDNAVFRDSVAAVVTRNLDNKILVLFNKKSGEHEIPGGGRDDNENDKAVLVREIIEETGYTDFEIEEYLGQIATNFFAIGRKEERTKHQKGYHVVLRSEKNVPPKPDAHEDFELHWMEPEDAIKKLNSNIYGCYESEFIKRFLNQESVCFTGEGELISSGQFSGLGSERAKREITKFVGGRRKTQYRLRDWSVSRQRYWGVPIPMIYCEKCGITPVPEDDLPVKLPPLKNYRPKGAPPLASSEEFMGVKCPKCGGGARRDPETLDTFVDSSWYFLRYTDPHNDKEPFGKSKAEHWLPVDLYVIGAEHTTLHLLYARFITKFLEDIGYLEFSEPFLKLRHQGLILGENGQKMSKSKGNVVNPDDIVAKFGADTVRLYEMFMGPFEQGQPWDPKGVLGAHRFLNRAWSAVHDSGKGGADGRNKKLDRLLHRTIKKVSEDIKELRFNTAVSALMILLNELENREPRTANYELFIKLLHPFAPHLAQELWSELGHDTYLDFEEWPEYDENLAREEKATIVVQVNGKIRDSFEADADISEEEVRRIALGREKVRKYAGDKEPKKVVYVKGKLINIVT